MREIQFRGKRIDTDEWTTGSLIVTHNRHYGITTMTKYDATCEDRFKKIDALTDEVYPESVGQFTGRKDKNGKMIYEGDIIKNEYEVGEVVWDEERDRFFVDSNLPKALNLFLHYPSEIIGNKYDNREIMKTKIKLTITERIKTFENACRELGDEHPLVKAYNEKPCYYYVSKDLEAYLKLRIVCAALNEGWEPQFTENESRYYTYFMLYSEKDVERMDEKTKQELGLFGGVASDGAGCGFVAADAAVVFGYASAYCGSRLCLRTRELAEYCGRQFIDLWADFYLIQEMKKRNYLN